MLINGDKVVSSAVQSTANSFTFSGNLVAATTTGVGDVLKLQNTTGVDLLVELASVEITTGSAGVATINMGVNTDGTTADSKILNAANAQTVGFARGNLARWKANGYIVATASATLAGMSAKYVVRAIPIA